MQRVESLPMFSRLPAVVVLVVAVAIPLRCQSDADEPNTFRVSGRVVSKSGVPIAGARVILQTARQPDGLPTQTTADGRFAFPHVEPGAYWLEVSRSGFIVAIKGLFVPDKDVEAGDIVLEARPRDTKPVPAKGAARRSKPLSIVHVEISEPDHAAVITYSDGSTFRPPKEDYQASCGQADLSDDHQAAGWLVEYYTPSVTYPIAGTLVIYRPGKPLRRFSADTVFWSWHFVAEGKQVAYCQNSLHPETTPPDCELRDVETGRLIDDNRNSTGKSPDWMAGLAEE